MKSAPDRTIRRASAEPLIGALRAAYVAEVNAADAAVTSGDAKASFHHLEQANVGALKPMLVREDLCEVLEQSGV